MISQCLLGHEEIGEKYILVNDILSASNHYEALGVSGDSSCDEIRRAYIKVIRIHLPIVVHFLIMHYFIFCRKVGFATRINSYHLTLKQRKAFNVGIKYKVYVRT